MQSASTAFFIPSNEIPSSKTKEKSRSTAGYFASGVNRTVPQTDLWSCIEIEIGDENVLPQLPRRSDFGMDLSELCDHSSFSAGLRGPPG